MRIVKWKHTRFFAVIDAEGNLVCVCVYRQGAEALVRRLGGAL